MDGNKNVTKISDSISKALERLFKAGGFALAFGFAGIILMIIANLPGGKLYWPLFGAGSALTFICLIYFVVEQSRSKQVAAKIGENAPLFDELQSLALHLIEFASLAQAFSFKHIQKVEAILKKVAPLIENLPVVGPKVREYGLGDVAKVSATIVETTEKTKKVIQEIDEAIRTGDLKLLHGYAKELRELLDMMKEALKA